jgi:two-component system, OmpR family, sensor kinase
VIGRFSLRWQLVAWVVVTMLAVLAIVFVVVYRQSGSQLRSQTDADVRGDITQLSEAVKGFQGDSPRAFAAAVRRYVRDQPSSPSSSLLFAVVPGQGAVTNHPELVGAHHPDSGESRADQARENALGRALLTGPTGLRTAQAPDLGPIRIEERIVTASGRRVRVGAGESLLTVTRAQRSIGRSFLLAGAIGIALVLLASYLAGAFVSRPLRRLARVAAMIDEGDLNPRMSVSAAASQETRVLADSFNRMLDRLASAFAHQRDFVADASHELRTPLTVIAGQLEVLAAEEHPQPADIERTQQVVQAEVARTSRLVDDMLLLIRADHDDFLRRRPIDLPTFIDDLWVTTTRGHERRLQLDPIPFGTLDADPDRLAQALRNLIDNALSHTSAPDGLVRLSVRREHGDRVVFTVSDDGAGIPKAHRDRVFERFHRTDDARDRVAGGAGLGLAIVRAIAEAHEGTVSAGVAREGGAELRVEVPGFQAAAPPGHDDRRRSDRESPFTQRL